MGENYVEFSTLSKVDERKFFHLHSGLDISSVRELGIKLSQMTAQVFEHHVSEERNDFATWIRDVFKDEQLAQELEGSLTPQEMREAITRRILFLEEQELNKFGMNIPQQDLIRLELYVEKKRRDGMSYEDIKLSLEQKGWKTQILELIIEAHNNQYKEYQSIEGVQDMQVFYEQLTRLKRSIINGIAAGTSVQEIKQLLQKTGWHDELVEFLFFDVFKPHPNIKKLSMYIQHQIKEKNTDINKLRKKLSRLGWKNYLVDSVIYGIKDPDNEIESILSYLDEFSPDQHRLIQEFLLRMGWETMHVSAALEKKQMNELERKLGTDYNVERGDIIRQYSKPISTSIIRIAKRKESNDAWKHIIKNMKKLSIKEFGKNNEELHADRDYDYSYQAQDIKHISSLEDKEVDEVYYEEEQKPLAIEMKNRYLVLPVMNKRKCTVCNKTFPITKLNKVVMWDQERTHKVLRYVCDEHRGQLDALLGETRIIQSG